MAVVEIRVANHPYLTDPAGEEVLYEIKHALGIDAVQKVRTAKVYRFEGIDESAARLLAEKLLAEAVFQDYTINAPIIKDAPVVVEVAYKPGVMNPEAASLMKAARDLGIEGLVAADSSREYGFYGQDINSQHIDVILERLLVNATVERVVTEKPATLLISGRPGQTEIIPLRGMSDAELMELSRDRLFLNLEEMKTIQQYFRNIGRDPTDCEIETLAQTWSEHCGHKTFKARLLVEGRVKEPLLKRLQEATFAANHPLVLSAFVDNSGVMEFYDGWAICGKVETHNSPSAIEPYGGAMTGSGGVFRDVMGTGQGARVIASTDMFCFAPPDTPREEIPPGCLSPHYLLRRVVAGVRDYGNRMGIPTNNGSVHFHRDFRAKPSVIVGAYGMLPVERCRKGQPRPGDLAVVIGGRTGRDGIHGATFSSGEMTHRTTEVNASAVQIGHPIEEKRVADAILAASEAGLVRAITDCGAGGFSSALGEMGEKTGVRVWLERAPLKYQGLRPWEIWLSESQERMIIAVSPGNLERLLEICRGLNVEATVLAEFTSDRRLVVTYENEIVCDLDMEFLHHGLPKRVLPARWQQPALKEPQLPIPDALEDIYCRVMSHLNVCSKEPIVRMYDHGVQGSCSLAPYGGVEQDGPNDAVVLTPLLGSPAAVIISHGLNPVLNQIDPYYGSLWAATEAVSNAVAVGANPGELVLIDNFIWPFPDEESLGALDRAVDACVDFVRATGMPFISGKDSLSSTYRGKDGEVIKIPPVLCVSVFGRLPDVKRTISSDFKGTGNLIVLVGQRNLSEMAGSVYYDLYGYLGKNLPRIDLKTVTRVWKGIFRAIQEGKILACHDISEGGLAAALAEMCFGGGVGAELNVPAGERPDYFLFNETSGCFLLEMSPRENPGKVLAGLPHVVLGQTRDNPVIEIKQEGHHLCRIALSTLKRSWKEPMERIFGTPGEAREVG
ncbi:phosphoribosylformylglycinamidine synthase subunit II [Desulfofundulus australicus DSM 11792]|uniref:Phosphoribosylformylglycinamidine synthase subunit PurL n=1 Tax=Desulfofundulus australicus DSM 11792 TaxID=1121425 RepID=A0A1M5B485_9FIRM|nr:phosphoribosylformylglycinamidine synthase subunit PurL [Desulfofundulus australicus]SHF37002.1 phosphoribosylformylglycinamidine synthase subunit II [Desulfofundulus australicus DSM 11792]